MNLGHPTFNAYCENQKRVIGWLQSKTNPIQAQARDLRAKRRGNDPSVRSMFEDVEREFVAPLVAEHVKRGGEPLSGEQIEATCAMLLAKILWDSKPFGRGDVGSKAHSGIFSGPKIQEKPPITRETVKVFLHLRPLLWRRDTFHFTRPACLRQGQIELLPG